MNSNNIDDFFKSNIKQEIDFGNKEISWNRLEKKRKKQLLIKTMSFIIISAVISLSLLFIKIDYSKPQNKLSEYQKKELLLDIEKKLTKSHEYKMICENCYKNLEDWKKQRDLMFN